jgi:transposase
MTKSITHVAGVDISKEKLSVCLLPEGEVFELANDAQGHGVLIERCRAARTQRVVVESTSIYHKACSQALGKAGFEVAVLQPLQAKAFAALKLKRAKTDRIDAELLAGLGLILDAVAALPSLELEALAETLTYLEQLDELTAWTKTTRERFQDKVILKTIDADIKRLARQRAALVAKLLKAIRKDEAMARRLELLVSIPGLGERTAITLIVRMPELGTITREEASSLAGLAPLNKDSGKQEGERHIHGGRKRVRKAIFMAALASAMKWNPQLVDFYAKRKAKGMSHKPAIVACARKLLTMANAVLKRGTPWQKTREVMP